MSNFQPTIGRAVQYIGEDGRTPQAAIISDIKSATTVSLHVFGKDGSTSFKEYVGPYLDTFDGRKLAQPNTYLLHWQNR